MRKHKSADTKSESDLSGERFSTSPGDQIPPYETKDHHAPLTCIDLPITARFRLLVTGWERLKLLKDWVKGEVLILSKKGMLVSTYHPVPDQGLLLTSLILDQRMNVQGVLGRIKKVEYLDDGSFLVGVEFSPVEELSSIFAPQKNENLQIRLRNFKRKPDDIVSRHLHVEKISLYRN